MRPIDTDGVAWSVDRFGCHNRELCENGWTDRDAVWVVDSGGPKEPWVLESLGPDFPCEGAILRVKGAPIVKYRDSLPYRELLKTAALIEMPFGICVIWGCTLAPPDEYDWAVYVRRRCGLFGKLLWRLVWMRYCRPKWQHV